MGLISLTASLALFLSVVYSQISNEQINFGGKVRDYFCYAQNRQTQVQYLLECASNTANVNFIDKLIPACRQNGMSSFPEAYTTLCTTEGRQNYRGAIECIGSNVFPPGQSVVQYTLQYGNLTHRLQNCVNSAPRIL